MTHVFFVRHAEPDYENHDEQSRALTKKGLADRKLVTRYLAEHNVNVLLSSPYLRALETIQDYADTAGLPITVIEDFRERRIADVWIEDFHDFSRRQWADFDYHLTNGESLREVQSRNIRALQEVLKQCRDQRIAIGSHGTALSTVIHYFQPSFGFREFEAIRTLMPWMVELVFDGVQCVGITACNLFERTETVLLDAAERKRQHAGS